MASTLVLTSCKKWTDDLNVSPNSPTDAPSDLLLNGTEVAGILVYEGNLARIAGMYAGSFTGADRQYISINNYTTSAPDYDDGWDNLYSTVIEQAILVRNKALAVNDKKTAGIAQVLLAQAFGFATDLWGDIPFSQVGDATLYPNPAFDKQADVYAGVQKLLDSALLNFEANVGIGPSAKDFYYQADLSKWTEAAHTLKARYYLHTKNYTSAIAEALQGISAPGNSLIAPHGVTYASDFNVYYSFLSYDRPAYMNAESATAPKYLDASSPLYKGNSKTNETARFNFYYQPELNTAALDPNVLFSDDWGNAPEEDGFFGAATSFPLISYEENQLILAEAYAKTSQSAEALAALNTHRAYLNTGANINSGYLSLGLQYDAYVIADFAPGGLANPATSGLTQDQALLREILLERYVTFIGQIEQFNDVRRTKNALGIVPATGSKLPQRFLYPQSEINTNTSTPKLAAGSLFTETTVNTTPY